MGDGAAGLTVPGFEIGPVLGRGGFSVVYRARQTDLDRDVALKVLTAVDLDEEGQRRFERECKAMGRLSWHPNIVVVHASGRTLQGQPFIAMELLPGGSLRDRLEQHGPLPPLEVAEVGIQAASALGAAHEAGLLHRDVKPDNLLLDAMGRVRLADFGIAGNLGTLPTQSGSLSATLLHAAPEVLEGAQAGIPADVYSLGSTLFALADGRAAFGRNTGDPLATLVAKVLREPVPDLRATGVPDRLASVVEQCMAKDPAARFQSMPALGNALEQAREACAPVGPDDRVTVVVPRSAVDAPLRTAAAPDPTERRDARSRRPFVVVGVVVAAVLIGAAVLAIVRSNGAGDADPVPGASTSEVSTSGNVAPATITVGDEARAVAIADDGRVWVATGDGVAAIDPATNEVVDRISGFDPAALAIGDGGMWASDLATGDVLRIDPSLGEVSARVDLAEVTVVAPADLAVAEGAVFTANGVAATMSRIDALRAEVTGTSEAVGAGGAWSVAAGEGSVFLGTEQTVEIFGDPFVLEPFVASSLPAPDASQIAVGEGSLWVTSSASGTLTRIDPQFGDELDVIDVEGGVGEVATGGGSVWVTGLDEDVVTKIDALTGEVLDRIVVGAGPRGVAVGDDSAWVASGDGTVSRIPLGA